MKFTEKLFSLLTRIFSYLSQKVETKTEAVVEAIEEKSEESEIVIHDDKVNVARRTLLTKLYILEQEIVPFKDEFPNEYEAYMERINSLRETYNSSLKKIKDLTFEIDPEVDSKKAIDVLKLERDVKNFIEKEVKFNIIFKRLQRLILKLNILYNVSIFHSKMDEKEKVMSQLKNAKGVAIRIAKEFKECVYVLNDKRLKDRVISLITFVDYEIFKSSLRNSENVSLEELINNLVMIIEFDEFDYLGAFKAFVNDEISDFEELLPLISDDKCRKVLKDTSTDLLSKLTCSNAEESKLLDINFWNELLDFESCLLEMLKVSGVPKEKIKLNIIARMGISLEDDDVIVLPITTAMMSLTSLYSKTQDKRILLMIKLLKNVSNKITYKEIYFLILLFDLGDVIRSYPNELIKYLKKYFEKYPYDRHTIIAKKRTLFISTNKKYVKVFELHDYEEDIIETLKRIEMDFRIEGTSVVMNSFYFDTLENVSLSLQATT